MKFLKTLILAFLWSPIGYAQDSPMPKIEANQFTNDHSLIDTSANAIVLFEYGRSELEYVESERQLMVSHIKHVRIKIFNKDESEDANIVIPLYKYGNTFEYLRELKGKTYNYENGTIVTTDLEKSAIFNEKSSEYLNLTKFTLPNIKNNSIIEYSYRFYTPNVHNFKKWNFQSDIPKLYSEYVAVIPSVFEYNVNLKGHYPLSDQKSELLSKNFLWGGQRQDCSKMTYIMRELPAFKEEAFMLAPVNYISSINFEMRTFHDANGGFKNFTRKWSDIDLELMTDKEFGGQIKNKGAFKTILPEIIKADQNKLEQAKSIYYYIQKNIVWNEFLGKYSQDGVKKALEQKKGNIADINFSLIAALSAAEIEAYPVLFSTRNNGIPSYIFPVMSDFNGVLCLAKIDGKDYLLDASKSLLPFGELSISSINDRGRIVYSKDKSDWIELINTVPSKTFYSIIGKINEEGILSGNIRIQTSGLEAYQKRFEIEEYNSIEEYEEKLIEKTTNFKIKSSKLENLENLESFMVETIEFELNLRDNFNEARILFNPIFYERTTKNPFNLEERKFHVDLGAARHESYNINISIPEKYNLSGGPKNMSLVLPESAAKFSYRSIFENNQLMIRQETFLNNAMYSPDEYFHLKELFSRIIQQQNTDFQFTKKND